mmetsp:Transcript_50329/g.114237  ORF Transcript_50329/g.114237 Transcript_50329/m.114237 type:complete len:279 (-) Transcript_50329:314-1150(-)
MLVHRRPALRLVHPVLRAEFELVEVVGREGVDEPGNPPHVEDHVLPRVAVREAPAGVRGLAHEVRDEDHHLQPRGQVHALRPPPVLREEAQLYAAVDRRCHVVRVSLDLAGDGQELLGPPGLEAVPRQDEPRDDPAHDGRRRRPETARIRDTVRDFVSERRHRYARHLVRLAEADADEVRLIAGDVVAPLALVHHGELVRHRHLDLAPHVERHPDRVETRSHVRSRRRNPNGDRGSALVRVGSWSHHWRHVVKRSCILDMGWHLIAKVEGLAQFLGAL